MDLITGFFSNVYNVPELIRLVGFYGCIAIVFAETGLLIGFFLPGDSLLVTAGGFAGTGQLNIVHLNLVLMAAAILGDTVGYWFGRTTGPALFKRPKSLFFNPEHLRRAHDFYEKHGGKTIVIARFMPIVRTFAPIVAGMGQMEYRRFLAFNVFGGIFWVLGRYDRPWAPTRPVFGTVRYMSSANTARKYDVASYVARNSPGRARTAHLDFG